MEVDEPKEETNEQPSKEINEEEFYDDNNHPDFDGDFSDENFGDFNRFPGRGGFRGRPWGPPGGPPRFRGRGFGPPGPMGPPMRGRAAPPGQPPYFRGRGSGPAPPGRFNGPNYDPNWGPMPPPGMMGPPPYGPPGMNGPPGMGPPHMMGGPPGHFGPPGMGPPPMMQELWVETKTDEGKSYFYHAISRETTWTRPEGPHIKIMSQVEVEAMTNKNQQQQQQQQQQQAQNQQSNDKPPEENMPVDSGNKIIPENAQPNMNMNGQQSEMKDVAINNMQPPMNQMMPNYGVPQNQFPGAQQFGMPPPGYAASYPPPGGWGVPPSNQWPQMAQGVQNHMQGNPNMMMGGGMENKFLEGLKPGDVDPVLYAKAAEWTEHRAPDGRPYYYHTARAESVWEKPQPLKDLEAVRAGMPPQSLNSSVAPPQMPMQLPNMSQPPINSLAQMQPPHQLPVQSVVFDPMGFVIKPQTGEKVNDDDSETNKQEKKRKLDADKKKKDDDDEKIKLVAKQQDKSRPISSTPISGTPWCVVWTGDGRVFFYNPSTRTSVWERPEELLERADVDKAISTPPEQLSTTEKEEKEDTDDENHKTVVTRSESETSGGESDHDGEGPNKKLKVENGTAISTVTEFVNIIKPIDKKADIGKEAAVEAEMRAARERSLVPLDIRVKSFKEMLKEKDVSAFSTWEKELHKIVFDPRYLLLTSRERKQVFEKYVKERAEEERREKRNKMRLKRDDFRQLMEAANLHGKSSFSDFAQKYSKDDRLKGIEKIRERESLFNEYIVEIRKKEKDDKIHKKEQIKKDFITMLRDHPDIDRHSRWSDIKKRIDNEQRYKAVDTSIQREDYFHEFCKLMKEEKKKTKEKDRDRKEKKSDKKDRDRSDKDSKDKDVKDKDREGKEKERKEHTKERHSKDSKDDIEAEDGEHPPTSEDEAERQQKERDRRLRAEASIKEREKEVQRTLATHLRDRDKEREHHKRDEAMRHFSALLADLVRNPDLTWKEVKKQLRKDHRWELVEHLERDDRERLFNDHIDLLLKKKRDKFREMLDEIINIKLTSSWKEIKKSIKEDPRYLKFNSSEKCEREYREYIKDKVIEAKASFRELLQECKLITHKSYEQVKENPNHLKEIEEILKNDKRCLVLDHMSYERTQILNTYLDDLHKRGPPPPPTASDSTRRK